MTDTARRSTPQRFQRETNVALVLKLLRERAVRRWLEQWTSDFAKEGTVVAGVGIGVPGLVDPSLRTVRESVALGVRDLDPGRLWSDDAGAADGGPAAVPLFVDNDANCCAWNFAEQQPGCGTRIFVQLNMHRDGTGGFRPSLASRRRGSAGREAGVGPDR